MLNAGLRLITNEISVMPSVLRNLVYESDKSARNFRILKDYFRALEYFILGLHHFTFSLQFEE